MMSQVITVGEITLQIYIAVNDLTISNTQHIKNISTRIRASSQQTNCDLKIV